VAEPVRLTIVPNELAAETIRALLETEGIESIQRKTDLAAGMTDASTSSFGPREILVSPEDLERARDLIGES
jgi:5,10-methenyltetrahydromethanopterin hydrogenase